MNELRDRKNLRRALDTTLSGLTADPWLAQRVLTKAKGEEKMKKKLSTATVVILAVLALGMAAALAGGLGILSFRENQADNEAFVQSIFTVGQTYEDDDLTLRINDAVFDGTRLALTMDVLPKAGGQQVCVFPRITAKVNGEPVQAFVEQCEGSFPDGFWTRAIEGLESATPQKQYVVIALQSDEGVTRAPRTDTVDWSLSFDLYTPNWPIGVTREQRPSAEAGELFLSDKAVRMDAAFDAQFAEAYRNHTILLTDNGLSSTLGDYGLNIPTAEGASEADTYEEKALRSEAFTYKGQASFAFTTRAESQTSPQIGQTFPLTEGWQAELVALNVTFDHIDCTMKLTRSAADGKTALQAYKDGEHPWDFAILPEGGEAINPLTNGYGTEDGDMIWLGTVEITSPVSRITLIPCRSNEPDPWVEAILSMDGATSKPTVELAKEETTAGVYEHNGAVTEAQKDMALSVDVE